MEDPLGPGRLWPDSPPPAPLPGPRCCPRVRNPARRDSCAPSLAVGEGAGRSGRCGENLGDSRSLDVGGRTWAGPARRWGPQAPDRPQPPRLCGASQLDRCQLRGLPALQVPPPLSGPGGNHPLKLSWQQLRHSPFSFARLDEAAFAISVYFYNDSNKEQPEAAAPAGPGEGREEGPRQRAPSNRAKVPHPRRRD